MSYMIWEQYLGSRTNKQHSHGQNYRLSQNRRHREVYLRLAFEQLLFLWPKESCCRHDGYGCSNLSCLHAGCRPKNSALPCTQQRLKHKGSCSVIW